jgi:D-cysteine desulfhydrase
MSAAASAAAPPEPGGHPAAPEPGARAAAPPRPGGQAAAPELPGLAGRRRVSLVLEPTPLHPAPRLSRELGVPILLKRDDLTGLGLGGNKLRGLEYILADLREQGCDCLVTGAGPQSNWTLLAALACLRCQVEPHVVCYGEGAPGEGNMRLHRWLGTDLRFTGDPDRASVDAAMGAVVAELHAQGKHPYLVPRGGATPLGALGYLRASVELAAQLATLGERPAGLWLASGSGGTQAGLVAGAALAGASYRVRGVAVSRPADETRNRVRSLAAGAAALAGGDRARVRIAAPDVLDGWIGPGYGVPSPEGQQAARLVAMTEGVFLDDTFGAKAMAALIAECRAGRVRGTQVFLVGGGAPTLFTSSATPPPTPGDAPAALSGPGGGAPAPPAGPGSGGAPAALSGPGGGAPAPPADQGGGAA